MDVHVFGFKKHMDIHIVPLVVDVKNYRGEKSERSEKYG